MQAQIGNLNVIERAQRWLAESRPTAARDRLAGNLSCSANRLRAGIVETLGSVMSLVTYCGTRCRRGFCGNRIETREAFDFKRDFVGILVSWCWLAACNRIISFGLINIEIVFIVKCKCNNTFLFLTVNFLYKCKVTLNIEFVVL